MANNHSDIEKRLWASAYELRANSKLKSSEYSVPVLGLIFLRYADFKFAIAEKELAGKLLQTLKQAKLVLDWRKKLRTRADVFATVKTVLDDLPRIYTPEIYQEKCDSVYRHVFDAYQGEGQSIYGIA